MSIINVAIDGPAGAGKSSVAKAAAKELGFVYIDTGAMYRTVALGAIRNGISLDDGASLGEMTRSLKLCVKHQDGVQKMYLDGEDVSEEIRKNEISMAASRVSAHMPVRQALVALQQKMAKTQSVIMDGRDICIHVLPDARVKIYLTASVDARAQRRYAEFKEKGEDVSLEKIKADITARDYADMHRENSPLVKAEDAKLIDTSALSFAESVDAVISYIKERVENVL